METILLIAEGTKAEPRIIDNLKNIFFNDKIIIKILYGTSIYHLYEKIKEDEDIDIVEILREMSSNNREILKDVQRKSISSIFLFFDHDSHATNADEEKIKKLIEFFNNETDKGKLYISYPMLEALRYIDNLSEVYDEKDSYWPTTQNRFFKQSASNKIRSISHLSTYNYDLDTWNILNRYNWRKANLLINKTFSLPDYNTLSKFTQNIIHIEQQNLMNNSSPDKVIVILSSFSFFISDYFKEEIVVKMLNGTVADLSLKK